jgi:hypothetical protein
MSRHLQALVSLIDDLTLKDVQTRFVCRLLKRCGNPLGDQAVVVDSTEQKASSPLNLVPPTKLSRGRLWNCVS